jgi:hypothetical protein
LQVLGEGFQHEAINAGRFGDREGARADGATAFAHERAKDHCINLGRFGVVDVRSGGEPADFGFGAAEIY